MALIVSHRAISPRQGLFLAWSEGAEGFAVDKPTIMVAGASLYGWPHLLRQ